MTKEPTPTRYLTIDFAKELLSYWEEDISPIRNCWCWTTLTKEYPHLKTKAEEYFDKHKHGLAAYCMVSYCQSKREWAEAIIEETKDEEAAQLMIDYCGSEIDRFLFFKKD